MIRIKRTYDPRARGDGHRVLVERLWPRGMRKEALETDAWIKEVAPSTELRKWFAHQVERWDEFQQCYRAELDANAAAWAPLLDVAKRGTLTLLYSAHDVEHNGALVLRDYLTERMHRTKSTRKAPPIDKTSSTRRNNGGHTTSTRALGRKSQGR